MDQEAISAATEMFKANVAFVYSFFRAAELEARATERYILIALSGMYSYFAIKDIPTPLRRLAWYAPVLLVVFAAIRALGLLLRQQQLLGYLAEVEGHLPHAGGAPGWASWYLTQPSVVALPTVVFYLLLMAITVLVARRMTRTGGPK